MFQTAPAKPGTLIWGGRQLAMRGSVRGWFLSVAHPLTVWPFPERALLEDLPPVQPAGV
jgi:hypothetical protein